MELSLKKLLLLGIGTAAYSYEKAMATVEDLVAKGELTVNQGKELNQELKKKAQAGQGFAASALDTLKDDIEELKLRLTNLEQR